METLAEAPAAAAVRTGSGAEVLDHIRAADVDLAIWQRCLPEALARCIDDWPVDTLPVAHIDVFPAEAGAMLDAACDASGTPRGLCRDALVADITGLVARFAAVAGCTRVRLRLEAISDNACHRLHRDCVPLRLLTTYRGPGTQWVAPEHSATALAQADDYAGPLRQLATHSVGIFKGCGFPGQMHDSGIVHRSPPIAGTATSRLVLCVNVPPAERGGAP